MTGMEMFVWWIVMTLISYALAPKPKVQNAAVQEGQVPTASASDPIPVVFGTVYIKKSNVVWWGDPGTRPIRTKGGKK